MAVFAVCLCSGAGSHPQPPSSSLEEQSLKVPLAPHGQPWQVVEAFPRTCAQPASLEFPPPHQLCVALQIVTFRCRAGWSCRHQGAGTQCWMSTPWLHGAAEIGVKEETVLQYLPAPGFAAEFTWKQKSQGGW